jgi:FAD/FMN-containing dehydrogenase
MSGTARTARPLVERYRDRLDPGFRRLSTEVRALMDPDGILNPGRWNA